MRRIVLDLSAFFDNHRKQAYILLNSEITLIKDLLKKITSIFDIENFFLTCDGIYLPPKEEINIILDGDLICVVPINIKNKLNKKEDTVTKNQPTTYVEQNFEQSNTSEITNSIKTKHKKHKKQIKEEEVVVETDWKPKFKKHKKQIEEEEAVAETDWKPKHKKHKKKEEIYESNMFNMEVDEEQPYENKDDFSNKNQIKTFNGQNSCSNEELMHKHTEPAHSSLNLEAKNFSLNEDNIPKQKAFWGTLPLPRQVNLIPILKVKIENKLNIPEDKPTDDSKNNLNLINKNCYSSQCEKTKEDKLECAARTESKYTNLETKLNTTDEKLGKLFKDNETEICDTITTVEETIDQESSVNELQYVNETFDTTIKTKEPLQQTNSFDDKSILTTSNTIQNQKPVMNHRKLHMTYTGIGYLLNQLRRGESKEEQNDSEINMNVTNSSDGFTENKRIRKRYRKRKERTISQPFAFKYNEYKNENPFKISINSDTEAKMHIRFGDNEEQSPLDSYDSFSNYLTNLKKKNYSKHTSLKDENPIKSFDDFEKQTENDSAISDEIIEQKINSLFSKTSLTNKDEEIKVLQDTSSRRNEIIEQKINNLFSDTSPLNKDEEIKVLQNIVLVAGEVEN